MKAKELIKLLLDHPEAEVKIGYEEHVSYSEYTDGTEERIERIEAIFQIDGDIVLSPEAYLIGEKMWPSKTDAAP